MAGLSDDGGPAPAPQVQFDLWARKCMVLGPWNSFFREELRGAAKNSKAAEAALNAVG